MGFEQYKTTIIENISWFGFASNNLARGLDWGNMWNDTVYLLSVQLSWLEKRLLPLQV